MTAPLQQAKTASRHPLAPVFQAATVRLRCANVVRSIEEGRSAYFKLDRLAMPVLAASVAAWLAEPGRLAQPATDQGGAPGLWPGMPSAPGAELEPAPWCHLVAGGVDRLALLQRALAGKPPSVQARALFDLAFVSALVGTEPGPRWRYSEATRLAPTAFVKADGDDLLRMLDQATKSVAVVGADVGAGSEAGNGVRVEGGVDAAAATTDTTTGTTTDTTTDTTTGTKTATTTAPTPPEAVPAAAPSVAPATDAATEGLAGDQGLAVAVLRAFMAGAFSAHPHEPLRVDATTLRHMDTAALRALLQAQAANPLQGLEARAAVLARWGQALQRLELPLQSEPMPQAPGGLLEPMRPSHLIERWAATRALRAGSAALASDDTTTTAQHPTPDARASTTLDAAELVADLAQLLAPVWAGSQAQGLPAGDVWAHRWAGEAAQLAARTGPAVGAAAQADLGTQGWVPFHANVLALVQALQAPLALAGWQLVGVPGLVVAATRANVGLLLATGLVTARHASLLARERALADELVVEARALAVCLFDELAAQVRAQTKAQLPAAMAPVVDTLSVQQLVQACAAVMGRAPHVAMATSSDGTMF